MATPDLKGLSDDIRKHAAQQIEKQIANTIRQKFPEIASFSVKVNFKSGKITITGLTKEQAELVK